MYSRLGMLFESSRKVAGGNGGQISNTANIVDTRDMRTPQILQIYYVISLKKHFHKLELFIMHTIVSNSLEKVRRLVGTIRCIFPILTKT